MRICVGKKKERTANNNNNRAHVDCPFWQRDGQFFFFFCFRLFYYSDLNLSIINRHHTYCKSNESSCQIYRESKLNKEDKKRKCLIRQKVRNVHFHFSFRWANFLKQNERKKTASIQSSNKDAFFSNFNELQLNEFTRRTNGEFLHTIYLLRSAFVSSALIGSFVEVK